MDIRALTPDLAEAFFDFFDHRAFSDNPYWKGCYCTFFHRPEKISEEEARQRPTRREQARSLIQEGVLRGYLAFDGDGKVLGWCNANRKSCFLRLGAMDVESQEVLAIVCFVIDPAHRRQGIARALLERALVEAAHQGLRWAEAYPSTRARSESGHYHGPLALYESLGFQRMPGRKVVVRKALDPVR
jgi:GNAT superfamily N-acetyltransferase